VFSKIFETVLKNRIVAFLTENRVIHPDQIGFLKNSNTSSATINLMTGVVENVEKKKKTACVFVDLKKAFDCVNHTILLEEFASIGIVEDCKDLIVDFMHNRHQYVRIGSATSEKKQIKCGIAQGSVLGPSMFIIFINSVFCLKLKGKIQLFADDAVLL
jgi:hypothetical protein